MSFYIEKFFNKFCDKLDNYDQLEKQEWWFYFFYDWSTNKIVYYKLVRVIIDVLNFVKTIIYVII